MEWIHCAPSESALNICDIFSRPEVTLKTIETRILMQVKSIIGFIWAHIIVITISRKRE